MPSSRVSGPDQMQRQRFELKFKVSPHAATAVRQAVDHRMEHDPFGLDQPDAAYPIHSLYLDSPGFALYRATINGDRNRFKLRVRFYNDEPDQPVFLETKRRVNDCILKERVAIHRERLAPMLELGWPRPPDLVDPTPGNLAIARSFCTRVDRLHARPTAHVSYRREAWFTPGRNSLRITLDHEVQCEPRDTFAISTTLHRPTPVFPAGQTILEIKFTERFPVWLSGLARELGLLRSGAAKYVDGLARSRQSTRLPSSPLSA